MKLSLRRGLGLREAILAPRIGVGARGGGLEPEPAREFVDMEAFWGLVFEILRLIDESASIW